MQEFAGAITRIAGKSTVLTGAPMVIMGGRSGKEFSLLYDAAGQVIWIALGQSLSNELHGALAAELNGDILWQGKVEKVTPDSEHRTCKIEVTLPRQIRLPAGVSLSDTITVTFPSFLVTSGNMPKQGGAIRFTGTLKTPESKKATEGVWVVYGAGPNAGETKVLVDVSGYSFENK